MGHIPRVGDYTMTLAGTTLTVVVAHRDASGALTGTSSTYTGTVAAGTTYTNWQSSGLDFTTATGANFANGAQTLGIDGFSTAYVSATVNPSATSDYSSSVTAYDSLGQPHVVTVYFRKSYETTTPQQSVWEWMAHLDAADSSTGANDLAGYGTLIFNNNGALVSGGGATTCFTSIFLRAPSLVSRSISYSAQVPAAVQQRNILSRLQRTSRPRMVILPVCSRMLR